MAEQIPYGIAENLLTKLGSAVFREIGFMFDFGDELRKLEDTLSTVRAVLLDVEEKQERSHSVSVWVSRLNDVVYDADDLIDDLEAEKLRREGGLTGRVSGFFSSSNPLAFRIKMGHRIKGIRESLDDVANDISKFNFIPRASDGPVRNRARDRETCSVAEKSHKIVGRDEDKKHIVDLLTLQSNRYVAVVGMGGLGKTTLAQLVYNDQGMSNHFHPKMWVCVSDDFDVKKLVRRVLNCVITENVENLELDQLQQLLRRHLGEKRYLLVLDDVWNEDPRKWGQFTTLLPAGADGSKLLVTTRSRKVAAVMGIDSPYIVEGLNEEDSWELFESLAFRKGEESSSHSNLVEIGREIAKMCKGVPLAIATIGSMLYFKPPRESQWLSIRNNRSLISLGDKNDTVSVLRLSYDNLPVHLKSCFAYCALFPKDYEMDKRSLVQLWMAQGYIQPSLENERLEDVGEEYCKDLLSRSLFQEFEEELGYLSGLRHCYYKMHDLVHDLAQSAAKSNMITIAAENIPNRIIPRKVHHVSTFGEINDLPEELLDKPIRTLHMERKWLGSNITSTVASRLKCLRVLKIFHVGEDLTSLAKLSHLRYLDLSDSVFKYLPMTIARLKHLQTLKLKRCTNLRKLPENIKEMISLRHLEIDGCWQLRYMPEGLGEMTQLRTLTQFQARGEGKHGSEVWELKRLDNLRGLLEIEGLSSVRCRSEDAKEAILGGKQYLETLSLRWGWGGSRPVERDEAALLMESLQPHPNLMELHMFSYPGVTFPNWMMHDGLNLLLPNLVSLTLRSAKTCQVLPPLGQLPSLQSLLLNELPDVVCMKDTYNSLEDEEDEEGTTTTTTSLSTENRPALGPFPSLKSLIIVGMPKWKGLGRRDVVAAVEHALFPCLEHLSLTFVPAGLCSHLLMGAYSSSLKTLSINTIRDMMSLPEEGLQHLSNLEKLSIYGCSDMTTLPSSIGLLTSLRELYISNCCNLTSLPEEMRSLRNLPTLLIHNCGSLSQRCQKDTGEDWPKISHIPLIFYDWPESEWYDTSLD